jgi:glycosidase
MSSIAWFKNAVIYHILIDRFAGFKSIDNWEKPDFLGGNIKGIVEKLPYLKKLGVDTIWISPFYKTSEYHGYHITDFFQVDPHFGTTKDIIELIDKVHKKDMRIIADFVPNHCSDMHPYFIDAQKNKDSEYRKWFYFDSWPDKYLCFLSIRQLPKINLDYPNARAYIINAAKHWLSLGFDGYRLDHCIGPSHNFWNDFTKQVKKNYPNVVLIGEAWMKGIKFSELKTINIKNKIIKWLFGASSDKLLKEYIGELDGVLDFRFQELIKSNIAYGNITKDEFYNQLKNHYNKYPDNYYLPTFLDNHDMNRFLFECRNNKEKLKKAAEIQFSIPQPHIIYYGTEKGMSQKKSIWSFSTHGDIQARKPMDWEKKETDLFKFYSLLINNKKKKRIMGTCTH